MSGRHRRVHVRCGHDIERKLCEAGIAGDCLAFADPAWLGPPAVAGDGPASRARLITERCALPVAPVRRQLAEAEGRLDRLAARYDHVVL
jgi:hypothetical protein